MNTMKIVETKEGKIAYRRGAAIAAKGYAGISLSAKEAGELNEKWSTWPGVRLRGPKGKLP